MGDLIKIGVKTALIAVIMVGIVAIFATVQVPSLDFSIFTQAVGVSLAVLYHYVPISRQILPIVGVILLLDLGILTFRLGMIAVKWIMKVNE